MALEIPACWRGLTLADVRRHRDERPEWLKIELLGGVLVATLRTRAVRELIDRLAATFAEQLPPGHLVLTSTTPREGAQEATGLRRQGLWHELAASALRADLQAQLGVLKRDDVAAVLGAGWRAIAEEAALWWTDVCLVPWDSLVEPIDGSERGRSPAPLLIVEVTEPQTSAFDRTERREAYAAGGCRWMVLVDPADPTIGRASSTIELLDLGDRHRVVARGQDHLRLADPLPLHIDLIEHGRFVRAVIEAEAAGEL